MLFEKRWVEVAVWASGRLPPRRPSDSVYTYSAPPNLIDTLAAGQVVRVPFGAKTVEGITLGLTDQEPDFATRPVSEVIDPTPAVSPSSLILARWIASNYRAPLIEALRLMVPPGLITQPVPIVKLKPGVEPSQGQGDLEWAIITLLKTQSFPTDDLIRTLTEFATDAALRKALGTLLSRGLVIETLTSASRTRPKQVEWVTLAASRERLLESTKGAGIKRVALLRWLADPPPPEMLGSQGTLFSELRSRFGGPLVRSLVNQGILASRLEETRRDPLDNERFEPDQPPTLTASQKRVFAALSSALVRAEDRPAAPEAHLLHGVTGSGKTELYLRLTQACLERGLGVIVLVPEISLTPQTIERFSRRFPGEVAILHSALTNGERFDEWRRLRDGKARIAIGSRSAVFAPVEPLGAIIIDEEHEPAYKATEGLRYHARETAIERGRLTGALVLLGSATPDVVTFTKAALGEYALHTLNERATLANRSDLTEQSGLSPSELAGLPSVEIVDLRAELRTGNRSIFSASLQRSLVATLERGEQAILYLNRRGHATVVVCRDCGQVVGCPRCDTSLVYHSAGEKLLCHVCGHSEAPPERCPTCRSLRVSYIGLGSQRVEEEVHRLVPTARVIRWDRDSVKSHREHREALRHFARGEADILVGTQMVAKGLDLPLLTLVGVVLADASLYLPDLRSVERTFQLLTQVAGRAGRAEREGKVILQTFSPDHYAIIAASQHDYAAFYAREVKFRRALGYPPFGRLARVVGASSSLGRVESEGQSLAEAYRLAVRRQGLTGVDVLGPAPLFHRKARGLYHYGITLRGRPVVPSALLDAVTLPRGWSYDIDPISTL